MNDQSNIPSQNLNQFLEQVEQDLLFHMYQNVTRQKSSPENVEQLAKEFLKLLPPKDKEDLLSKLNDLGKKYPEAKETYTDFLVPHEEQKRQKRLQAMRDFIKRGNIEQAISVAKGDIHV